ncbi:MAG: flagellar biosynthetic protein FliO [Lachnospiraceae bacterium]|nr:flagellar biosynthetic protein FliO [Lachnospiraceae bacterium]MDE7272652.1 flagellar biosynthetic protein FliO [Lachnospiraceae bacterium]
MLLSSTSKRVDSIGQLLTVTLIFIFVLALTYFATKLTAGLQKGRLAGSIVEVLETIKIAPTKYIQVVRIGKKYFSYIVCKDTVTLLGEVAEEDITTWNSAETKSSGNMNFKEIFDKFRKQ